MITVDNLVYEYPGKRALDAVSFSIAEGSITALVGPNGAGKTTLLRCIAALDEPLSGRITVNSIDVAEHPRKVHTQLGYLSDSFGLYGALTVRQCLIFAARLHLLDGAALTQAVDRVAGRLGLAGYLGQSASTLSRGWRQRLGIAQAIIHSPRLLLLDEPASGLDPEARTALSTLFLDLQKDGMTMLVSSHILAELEDYCTDMLVLRDGIIAAQQRATAHAASGLQRMRVVLLSDARPFLAAVEGIAGVVGATADGATLSVQLANGTEGRHMLLKSLVAANIPVIEFAPHIESLQDIYMAIPSAGKTH